jgi:tetratricopeptide (TPR) repeat protein
MAAAAGAQRSLGGILSMAHATRLLAIALPLTAAGAYFWHANGQSPAEVPPPAAFSQPPAVVAPTRAVPAVPVTEAEAEARPSEPTTPVSPERSASSVGEAAKPGNEIRQEVALLSKAQAALSRGRPQEALEALAEHAARFPRGALTEERAATRARTLCALGRKQEAEAELKRIERLNPASAYLARARESCGSR